VGVVSSARSLLPPPPPPGGVGRNVFPSGFCRGEEVRRGGLHCFGCNYKTDVLLFCGDRPHGPAVSRRAL